MHSGLFLRTRALPFRGAQTVPDYACEKQILEHRTFGRIRWYRRTPRGRRMPIPSRTGTDWSRAPGSKLPYGSSALYSFSPSICTTASR